MAWHDDSHVITCNGIVIWEAVTKPDINENSGNQSWNLRVAVDPNAPEVAELQELVVRALKNSSKPNVNLNNRGNNPISQIDHAKFPELPANYLCFSAGTIQGAPPVMDANGAEMQPMTYGPKLYNGTVVRLLVHAYAYDNKQKGVNYGLDGVQIIDGNAPRLAIGAAGLSKDVVKSAFGGVAAAAPAATTQAPPPPAVTGNQPPPPPHTDYMDTPPPPPVVEAVFPPVGWWPHPQAPGKFYNAGNEVLTEAQLRARG
jgi:hypothetical protein